MGGLLDGFLFLAAMATGAGQRMGRIQPDPGMAPDAAGWPGRRRAHAGAILGGYRGRLGAPRGQGQEEGEDQEGAAIHILDTIP